MTAKMRTSHHLPVFAFHSALFLILASGTTWAGNESDLTHLLSLDVEGYSQSFQLQDRQFEFDPRGLRLGYQLTIGPSWSIGVNSGKFDDESSTRLAQTDFEHTGWQLFAAYTMRPWWFSAQYTQEQESVSIQSTGPQKNRIEDDIDYKAVAFTIAYEIEFESAWLNLAINTEYQEQDRQTQIVAVQQDRLMTSHDQIKSDGWLGGVTITANSFISVSEKVALVPSTSLHWSEPISGTTHGSTLFGVRTHSGLRQQFREFTEEDREGSGQFDLALNVLFESITLNVGTLMPFDSSSSLSDLNSDKRIYAGINISF